ncbi:hypothetical protein [Flavobacterium sp.]|uniref:hypothetical protein n=1 Tax=Flavobacterium sp. TaxID=239 RepID=UPI002ED8B7C2
MEKAQKTFDYLLRDFQPNMDYQDTWLTNEDTGTKTLERYDVELPNELKIGYPFIVFFMFQTIKGYANLGMFEKVLWEIPIFYKGTQFVLAHKKFGFSISANEKNDNFQSLGLEAMALIHKAIPHAESLVDPIMHEKVNQGNVTIDSKYTKMRNRYLFFREKALNGDIGDEKTFIELRQNSGISNFADGDSFAAHINLMSRYRSSKTYYLLAMIDAYFSLLEHISILLLFVKEVNLKEVKLENFMGMTWKAKLRIILQYKTNRSASRYLEVLDEIKEQIRNPAAHGDYFKNGGSLYVHIEGIGAIPFTLTKAKQNFKFSDTSSSFMTGENIVKHFDDFDSYLETSNTGFGMMYIKRDLPVAFDKESVAACRRRTKTEKSTKKYIDDTLQEINRSMDMDW